MIGGKVRADQRGFRPTATGPRGARCDPVEGCGESPGAGRPDAERRLPGTGAGARVRQDSPVTGALINAPFRLWKIDFTLAPAAADPAACARALPAAPLRLAPPAPLDLSCGHRRHRSEEHTSELQSLMRLSYAVFCLKK